MISKILMTAIAAGALLGATSFSHAQTKKQQDGSLDARAQAPMVKQARKGTAAPAPAPQTFGYGLQSYDMQAPGPDGSPGGGVGSTGEGATGSGGGIDN